MRITVGTPANVREFNDGTVKATLKEFVYSAPSLATSARLATHAPSQDLRYTFAAYAVIAAPIAIPYAIIEGGGALGIQFFMYRTAPVVVAAAPAADKLAAEDIAAESIVTEEMLVAENVAPEIAEEGFRLTRHGELANGVYTVSKEAMKKHIFNTGEGRSIFYSSLNANEAVLKAAQYADKAGLWINNKAKVPVLNTNIGVLGTGYRTNVINVYISSGFFIHGSPGSIR